MPRGSGSVQPARPPGGAAARPPARPAPRGLAGAVRGRRGRRRRRRRRLRGAGGGGGGGGPTAVPAGAERAGAGPEPAPWGGAACEPRRAEPRAPSGARQAAAPEADGAAGPGRARRAERSRAAGEAAAAAKMADLEAVLADVSYLMAMEKSKATPAARASKKILLPEPR